MIAWIHANWDWFPLAVLAVAWLILSWRDRVLEERDFRELVAKMDLIRKGWER